jgi:hypothetical protein
MVADKPSEQGLDGQQDEDKLGCTLRGTGTSRLTMSTHEARWPAASQRRTASGLALLRDRKQSRRNKKFVVNPSKMVKSDSVCL